MIKLSDVKVRVQYRLRVRQRLMVLQFARLHGPTAAGRRFGVSARGVDPRVAEQDPHLLQVVVLLEHLHRDPVA